MTGKVVDTVSLAATGTPVLLDGAQGLGAVPVDVNALGCEFYAASGQKWLCGPNGIGYVYARADRIAELRAPWPGYHALDDPHEPLDSPLHTDARRLGTGYPPHHHLQWAHAALARLQPGEGFRHGRCRQAQVGRGGTDAAQFNDAGEDGDRFEVR